MDKLITEWNLRCKELDANVIKLNGKGGETTMGRTERMVANQLRQCIKDLQKKIDYDKSR